MSVMNLKLQILSIARFLVAHGQDPQLVDISAEIDRTLSLSENIAGFIHKLNIHIDKQKDHDAAYCDFLQEQCEIKCNSESCDLFYSGSCPGDVEPCPLKGPEQPGPEIPHDTGTVKIFCYRDHLLPDEDEETQKYSPAWRKARKGKSPKKDPTPDGKQRPGYGLTLYFVENEQFEPGTAPTSAFNVQNLINHASALVKVVPKKDHVAAIKSIQKWINTSAPIVQFFRNCIDSSTDRTRCLKLAKQAGIKYRRQNAFGLYRILEMEKEFQTTDIAHAEPRKIVPPIAYFERVRDFFIDEFAGDEYFQDFHYSEHPLTSCDASDITKAGDVDPGDFVFELGNLESGWIEYFGHYRAQTGNIATRMTWLDLQGLLSILQAR